MTTSRPIPLISGELKQYVDQIVHFYQVVGDKVELNSKSTTIFAYLQVYGALTQKQLKILTNFSSSTISTTLNSFLQSGIVRREILKNKRVGVYLLRHEKVTFVYTEFSQIIEELEKFDLGIMNFQEKLKNYSNEYPDLVQFLHLRLNSFRNYVEAQRRAINITQRYDFFPEDVSILGFDKQIINFPLNLEVIINSFVNYIIESSLFAQDNPIMNQMAGQIGMRNAITQEQLLEITGLSLSTISRYLKARLAVNSITAFPKQHKISRIYQQSSVSLNLINHILQADAYIFNYKPKFQQLLASIKGLPSTQEKNLVQTKLTNIITQIADFELGSTRLSNAKEDLKKLIKKK